MTRKAYRRKSDGKVAATYGLFEHQTGNFIKNYYVIFGEPANIEQSEVDDTDKWELIDVEVSPNHVYTIEKLDNLLKTNK
ncbi:MAG: hypothetical protein V4538_15110 [Bacteroidota bacterium]